MGWQSQGVNLSGPQGDPGQAVYGPLCITRLNVQKTLTAAQDWRPITEWKSTAEVDTHGMYRYNQGGDTWWQIPQAGRYRVVVWSRWAPFGNHNPQIPPWAATSVMLNGTDTVNNSISNASYPLSAGDATRPGATTAYPAVCEDRAFAAGDKLRVNFWANYGGTLAVIRTGAYTHIQIQYTRPI